MHGQSLTDIFIFGEVLFDCFPNEAPVLGGAPFNVSWHLHGFGRQPNVISAVGRDTLGDQILSQMQAWGLNSSNVQVKDKQPTGVVNVRFDNGEPHYEIKEHVAYDEIVYTDELDKLMASYPNTLLYHGSLAARSATSRDTLAKLKAHRNCFVDVNLRAPWWQYDQVMEAVTHTYFVKLNVHELNTLSRYEGPFPYDDFTWLETAKQFKQDMGIAHLLITRGEHGATLLDPIGESISVAIPYSNAPVADTVGAGDAFSSVVILGLLYDWPWHLTLERAQQFASYIVTQRGATTTNTNIYEGFRSLWHIEEPSHV